MIQPQFDAQTGLAPVIIVDQQTKQVLMMAYMNQMSFAKTMATNQTWFWSRSRQSLWHKGETSGNTQEVINVLIDCDLDTLLIYVKANGPACHTNHESCFFRNVEDANGTIY